MGDLSFVTEEMDEEELLWAAVHWIEDGSTLDLNDWLCFKIDTEECLPF